MQYLNDLLKELKDGIPAIEKVRRVYKQKIDESNREWDEMLLSAGMTDEIFWKYYHGEKENTPEYLKLIEAVNNSVLDDEAEKLYEEMRKVEDVWLKKVEKWAKLDKKVGVVYFQLKGLLHNSDLVSKFMGVLK